MTFNEKLEGELLVVQCTWSTNKSKGKKADSLYKIKTPSPNNRIGKRIKLQILVRRKKELKENKVL